MIPDVALISFALSLLIIMARFANIAKSFLMRLLDKNMIGSLKNGHAKSKPPQALPASE